LTTLDMNVTFNFGTFSVECLPLIYHREEVWEIWKNVNTT